MWHGVLGIFLLVSYASAAEPQDTGDSTSFVLKLALYHARPSMKVAELKLLITINSHLAHYISKRLQACRDRLRKCMEEEGGGVTYSNDGLSAAIFEWPYSQSYGLLKYFCMRKEDQGSPYVGEREVKLGSYDDCSGIQYSYQPIVMNNMFCVGCKKKGIDEAELVCMHADTGKTSSHPFVSITTDFTIKEVTALKNHFLRRYCNATDCKNTLKTLSSSSKYKLFSLFACYATRDQLWACMKDCFEDKGKKVAVVFGYADLQMSLIYDVWRGTGDDREDCVFSGETQDKPSVFAQATERYIAQLKKDKIFVQSESEKGAPSLEERLKRWEQFKTDLTERVVVKQQGHALLRYDKLSNTLRVIKYDKNGRWPCGLRIIAASKPMRLLSPVDSSSLHLNKKGSVKYKLKTDGKIWRYQKPEPSETTAGYFDIYRESYIPSYVVDAEESSSDDSVVGTSSDEYV